MTLTELTVVLVVLVALAGLAVPHVSSQAQAAACAATDATLARLRDALVGSGEAPGYLGDMGDLPYYLDSSGTRHDTLHFLFASRIAVTEDGATRTYQANGLSATDSRLRFNPATGRGWRGPYVHGGELDAASGALGVRDAYPAHAFIQLQIPQDCLDHGYPDPSHCARLVAAGPNGQIDTSPGDLGALSRGDDRVLFLRSADPGQNVSCVDG